MTETIRVQEADSVTDDPRALKVRSRPGRQRFWISLASITPVTALCFWLGYYTLLSHFDGFDDEGYLHLTLRNFVQHGGLFTHVFSTFGPFYFELFSTIFTWLPVTPDNAHVVTLVVVLLTTIGFGVAINLFTGRWLAGIATQAGTFLLLNFSFIAESLHPMILGWLLLAVALNALVLISRGRRSIGFMVLGGTLAGLVFTVVNVGAFTAVAFVFAGLTLCLPARMRFWRASAAILFIATPFLLIVVAGNHSTWALKYAVIVALAAAGVVVISRDRSFEELVHPGDVYRFLLGGSILGGVVVMIAILSGTRPVDLVNGVFIDPARGANAFTYALAVPVWVDVWGAVCLAGAVLYRRYRNRSSSISVVDAFAHVAGGLLILYFAISSRWFTPNPKFTVALPLLFLAAIPPGRATGSERIFRLTVVALAVLEGLLAYPVAGCQVQWSSTLMVPVGLLCLHDGLARLHPGQLASLRRGRRVTASLLALIALCGGLSWLGLDVARDLSFQASTYHANTPLKLPGSTMIRLPASQAKSFEALSNAIRAQCSSFVTFPAMDSLYFWTGEQPPKYWSNEWLFRLDWPLQKQLAHRIKTQGPSRFCVVDNPIWSSFWDQGHVLPQLPLAVLGESFMQENGPPELFPGDYRLFTSHGAAT